MQQPHSASCCGVLSQSEEHEAPSLKNGASFQRSTHVVVRCCRQVGHLERRLTEAAKLGFTQVGNTCDRLPASRVPAPALGSCPQAPRTSSWWCARSSCHTLPRGRPRRRSRRRQLACRASSSCPAALWQRCGLCWCLDILQSSMLQHVLAVWLLHGRRWEIRVGVETAGYPSGTGRQPAETAGKAG